MLCEMLHTLRASVSHVPDCEHGMLHVKEDLADRMGLDMDGNAFAAAFQEAWTHACASMSTRKRQETGVGLIAPGSLGAFLKQYTRWVKGKAARDNIREADDELRSALRGSSRDACQEVGTPVPLCWPSAMQVPSAGVPTLLPSPLIFVAEHGGARQRVPYNPHGGHVGVAHSREAPRQPQPANANARDVHEERRPNGNFRGNGERASSNAGRRVSEGRSDALPREYVCFECGWAKHTWRGEACTVTDKNPSLYEVRKRRKTAYRSFCKRSGVLPDFGD